MIPWIARAYACLLRLYPRPFRDAWGDEMCAVFADAVADAATRGPRAVFVLCARELRDWPAAILREQWCERSKMEAGPSDPMRVEPVSRLALLATSGPFLFMVAVSLMNMFPIGVKAASVWLTGIFFAVLIPTFLIGLLKGLPRWCLPYLGMLGSLASLVLFTALPSALWRSLRIPDPWMVRLALQHGFPWLGLIVLTVLFVLLTYVLPPLRPVYARIRQDWTLIAYGLYGAMMLAPGLTFEDYPPERWTFETACALILAVGAWAGLTRPQMRQRALVLLASITLTVAVATLGKALISGSPDWPYPGTPNWQGEALNTVIDGVWMLVVVLLVPALTNVLPRSAPGRVAGIATRAS